MSRFAAASVFVGLVTFFFPTVRAHADPIDELLTIASLSQFDSKSEVAFDAAIQPLRDTLPGKCDPRMLPVFKRFLERSDSTLFMMTNIFSILAESQDPGASDLIGFFIREIAPKLPDRGQVLLRYAFFNLERSGRSSGYLLARDFLFSQSKDEVSVLWAIRAVGVLGTNQAADEKEKVVAHIERWLNQGTRSLDAKGTAAIALGRLQVPSAMAILRVLLESETDPSLLKVVSSALNSLAESEHARCEARLVDSATNE